MTGSCKEDISLYFHIPFCSKKCPYCHFFVLPNEERFKKPFVQALLKEWSLRVPQMEGKRIVSIYFGGGTPTKLAPNYYAQLLEAVDSSNIAIASDCEITLEGNPEDITVSLMQQFHALGINRLSLGVQSLIDEDLLVLGRTHDTHRSRAAIVQAFEAGIKNISIDLMYELPSQGLGAWQRSLQALALLPITHLSLYNLTFEPHTVFFKQKTHLQARLAPDQERLQMLEAALRAFDRLGLIRYEISAFAKSGMQSRHNSGYWTGRPFLGFGPSAFSYWEAMRFSNVAHFHRYTEMLQTGQLPVDFQEKLTFASHLKERLAIHLRLMEGVHLPSFGALPADLEYTVLELQEKGWLIREGERLKLTSLGTLFYDSVAAEIV